MKWFAVSDLHGSPRRYRSLHKEVEKDPPPVVLMGGDLFPRRARVGDFMEEYLFQPIRSIRNNGIDTRFVLILGNDDPKEYEQLVIRADKEGLIDYIPMKKTEVKGIPIVGYPYVHPSPFLLKDWELYDVSRYVDPGCVSPLGGIHTTDIDLSNLKFRTIQDDLKKLVKISDPEKSVYLFHSPPYNTYLDLADIAGQKIDHVPLNPHIGSIAVQRFIEEHQPIATLHGHVHESFHLSGNSFQRIGRTLDLFLTILKVLYHCDICGKVRTHGGLSCLRYGTTQMFSIFIILLTNYY